MRNSFLSHVGIALLSALVTLFAASEKNESAKQCEPINAQKESLAKNNSIENKNVPRESASQVSGMPAIMAKAPDPIADTQEFKDRIVGLLSEEPSRISPGLRTRYLEMLDSIAQDSQLLSKLSRSEFERAIADPDYRPSIPGIVQIWIKNDTQPDEQVQIALKAIQHSASGSDQRVVRDILLKQSPMLKQELEDQMEKNGLRFAEDETTEL